MKLVILIKVKFVSSMGLCGNGALFRLGKYSILVLYQATANTVYKHNTANETELIQWKQRKSALWVGI